MESLADTAFVTAPKGKNVMLWYVIVVIGSLSRQ
jgi:hypothetical protein